jgi:hypothetical protein
MAFVPYLDDGVPGDIDGGADGLITIPEQTQESIDFLLIPKPGERSSWVVCYNPK